MPDKTIRDLTAGSAVSAGDLFLTRQGADTSDKKVTAAQMAAFAVTPGTTGIDLSSILLIGDSTASQNCSWSGQTSGSATSALANYQKAFTWMHNLLGNPLNFETYLDPTTNTRNGSVAAIGGASFVSTTATITTGSANSNNVPLSTFPQKYFWIQVGTNDINTGASLATLITNFTALVNAVIAAGKIPILTTVLTRNATDGVNDWNATGATAAQKRLTLASFNNWMVRYAKNNNILCINWTSVFTDPTTGNAYTGYTADGLHPSVRGAYYLALEAIRQLGKLLPAGRIGQQIQTDVYDATYNPYGNILNGSFVGTPVTSPNAAFANTGGGTGTLTGSLPPGFQISKNTSSTTSVVTSLVTRNGMNAVKLVFTATGGGNASEDWRFSYWTGASTSLSGFGIAGDLLSTEYGLEVEAGTLGVIKALQPRLSMNAGVTVGPVTTISFNAGTNTINDSANGLAGFPVGYRINVAGSTSNNNVYLVTAVSAGTLTISPLTPVTTEAAGASITIRLPAQTSAVNASGESYPNENTGLFYSNAPILKVTVTGNVTPRLGIYIDGTKTGPGTVYVYMPTLNKLPFQPTVTTYIATDN